MPAHDLAQKEKEQQRIRQGDRAVFERLFHAYYDDLCAFVQAHVRVPDVAEDLVQDLFLDLWRRRCMLHMRFSLKAYLFGAARNLALGHLEHRQVSRRWERQRRQTKLLQRSVTIQDRSLTVQVKLSLVELSVVDIRRPVI